MLFRWSFLVLLSPFACSLAHGQYSADQAESLKGVESVQVVWSLQEAQTGEVYDLVALELRKSGLRVAQDTSDIILNLGLGGTAGGLLYRVDVEQDVVIPRTGDTLQVVTWFYEDVLDGSQRNLDEADIERFILRGVNRFLSDYLEANGR